MPSDAKKKRDLAKKQAAKAKGGKPKPAVTNGDVNGVEEQDVTTNGHTEEENGKQIDGDDVDDFVRKEG